MDPIRRFHKPPLRRPRAIVAFEGWNDACDAASGATTYLLGQFESADTFAVIEPEEFFDFRERRPTLQVTEGGTRGLTWPTTTFTAVEVPDSDRDLIVVTGEEPSLRWKTFSRHVTQLLCEMDVDEAVLLGAFIGQVAHTRPVPLMGVATDPALIRRHGLPTSDYEGPTGIVGVLQEACREVGLQAISLWAATPHYLAANPNPQAMLALMQKAGEILDLRLDPSELNRVVAEFTQRVDEAMRASDAFAEYVSELEHEGGGDLGLPDEFTRDLVSEIEDYLRHQG